MPGAEQEGKNVREMGEKWGKMRIMGTGSRKDSGRKYRKMTEKKKSIP